MLEEKAKEGTEKEVGITMGIFVLRLSVVRKLDKKSNNTYKTNIMKTLPSWFVHMRLTFYDQ